MKPELVITLKKVNISEIACKNGYKFVRTRDCEDIRKILRHHLQSLVYTEKEYAVVFGEHAWMIIIEFNNPYMHPDVVYQKVESIIEELIDELHKYEIVTNKTSILSKGSLIDKVKGLWKHAVEYDQPPLPKPKGDILSTDSISNLEGFSEQGLEDTEEVGDEEQDDFDITGTTALDYLNNLDDVMTDNIGSPE